MSTVMSKRSFGQDTERVRLLLSFGSLGQPPLKNFHLRLANMHPSPITCDDRPFHPYEASSVPQPLQMMNGHHFAHKFRFLTWFRSKVDKLNCCLCLQKALNSMLFQGDNDMREMLGEGPLYKELGIYEHNREFKETLQTIFAYRNTFLYSGILGNHLQRSLHMGKHV